MKSFIAALILCIPVSIATSHMDIPHHPFTWRPQAIERGMASWYGAYHHGKVTASGEPFDMFAMTAASRTLPLGTVCEVVSGARSVVVKVTDRGPYVDDRIIDLSFAAMAALDGIRDGLKEVEVYACR